MSKVSWVKEDTFRFEDPFEDNVIYEFENDELKLERFEEWMEFKENTYYDGTPPPDFVTVIELELE